MKNYVGDNLCSTMYGNGHTAYFQMLINENIFVLVKSNYILQTVLYFICMNVSSLSKTCKQKLILFNLML
jgi:hypothetical protein